MHRLMLLGNNISKLSGAFTETELKDTRFIMPRQTKRIKR